MNNYNNCNIDLSFNHSDEHFDYLMSNFVKNINNTEYIFEVTKLCSDKFSQFVLISKDVPLVDLYKHISYIFMCNDIKSLLYLDNNNTFINIPLTSNINVRKFVVSNKLKPIYGINKQVVYRIFIDDGHVH